MFTCPACQTENRETAKFCRKCGLPREKAPDEPEPAPPDPPAPAPAAAEQRVAPRCPSCGANVRAADKFCIWCGEAQPQRAGPKMKRCAECRTQLPLAANFCYVCGSDAGQHQRRRVRPESELFGEDDPDLFPKFEA